MPEEEVKWKIAASQPNNQTKNWKCVAFLYLCLSLRHKSKSFISCVCFKCFLFVVFMPLCQCVWWHYVSRLFPSCERDISRKSWQTFFRFGSNIQQSTDQLWDGQTSNCEVTVTSHLSLGGNVSKCGMNVQVWLKKTGETSWLTAELLIGCGCTGWNYHTRLQLRLTAGYCCFSVRGHGDALSIFTSGNGLERHGCKIHWCMEAYNHRVVLVGSLNAAFVLCFLNLQDVASVTVSWAIVPAATMKCDSTN